MLPVPKKSKSVVSVL